MWSYHNDDTESLAILLEMGTVPALLSPDTRFWGVTREGDVLTADGLTALLPELGELDRTFLTIHLAENQRVELRPVFGRLALNSLRPNSHVFFELLAPLVAANDSCKWFAQFAYFQAWREGREDIAITLLKTLSLSPNLTIVEARMGLEDPSKNGFDLLNPDRAAPWVIAALKGGYAVLEH
jgi:hypothetical protein